MSIKINERFSRNNDLRAFPLKPCATCTYVLRVFRARLSPAYFVIIRESACAIQPNKKKLSDLHGLYQFSLSTIDQASR